MPQSPAPLDNLGARAPSLGPIGIVAFAAALLVWSTALTWLCDYRVHDADSRLYVALAQELGDRPVATWCAPVWQGHWGREGLFVEHPPGLFWAGAMLHRMGLPPYITLYVVNQAAWLLGLWCLFCLGQTFANRRAAALALCIWGTCPAFVQYLVRGDQEHPLATSILLGLVGVGCVANAWLVGALWALAFGAGCLFKGLPALALLPLGVATAIAQKRPLSVWLGMGVGSALVVTCLWLFELWYTAQTQKSFLHAYLTAQVSPSIGRSFSITQKLVNVAYYAARPVWFALPAVALVAWGLWRRRKNASYPNAPPGFGGFGFDLGLGALLLFVCAFSLADRKADRYLFAAYPLFALGAAVQLEAMGGRWQSLAATWLVKPWRFCAYGSAVLAGAVALKVYVGTYHYVFVRLWPGA